MYECSNRYAEEDGDKKSRKRKVKGEKSEKVDRPGNICLGQDLRKTS